MTCRHEVLAISEGIDVDTHVVKWDLALCLLFAWIFVFFCVIGGVKSVGKVITDNRLFCCRPTQTLMSGVSPFVKRCATHQAVRHHATEIL